MNEYAEDVIAKAEATAREMAEKGESLREVSFGQASGTIWISDDRDKVVVDKIIIVDGKEFFIGLFKK